jgi:ABC-2 type transport system permease protein
MSTFTHTGRLILLALRRDRIKLPIWIFAIVGLLALGSNTLKEVYGTAQQQLVYASTTSSSVIARMFGGPVDGPNMGSVVMVEYYLFLAVLIAFMSTLAIVRHTRQNEETGRSELIGSAVVGRNAMLNAALTVVIGANLIVIVGIAAVLIGSGLPAQGSLIMAVSLGGVGIVFAVIAAVIAQIVGTARGANSLAAAIIGATFLIRAIGDGIGPIARDGLSAGSAWLSWLSPFAWGEQAHPFTVGDWWPLALYVISFIVLLVTAFYLATHRDFGLGMLPARRGPARAARSLLSPLGLAWRLQRGMLIGWTTGILITGITFGVSAVEFQDLLTENEQFTAILQQMGGSADKIIDLFFMAMMSIAGIVIAGYALQALMRLRSEESGGQLEAVLATSVSKTRWMISHIAWVLLGILVLTLVMGVSTGIAYVLASGEPWSQVSRLTVTALIQVPAILTLTGAAIVLFGILPRLTTAVSWAMFAACLLVVQLGEILKLPEWVQKLSPFSHTPGLPDDIDFKPILIMGGIFLGMIIIGFATFRRRDLTTA